MDFKKLLKIFEADPPKINLGNSGKTIDGQNRNDLNGFSSAIKSDTNVKPPVTVTPAKAPANAAPAAPAASAPANAAPAQTFGQAFAAGRKAALAGGDKTFKWTDPKTGKEGTYGTDIKKPAAKAVPNPDQSIVDAGNRQRDAQQAILRGDKPTDRFASSDASNPTNLNRPRTPASQAAKPAPDYTVDADPAASKVPYTPKNTTGYTGVQQYQYSDGKPNANYDSGEKTGAPSEVPVPANIGDMNPTDSARELNAARASAGKAPVGGTVGSGTGTTWTSSNGQPVTFDSPEEIARRGPMGTRLPDPVKQREQGEKNWNAIKGFFGGNKSTPTSTSTPNDANGVTTTPLPPQPSIETKPLSDNGGGYGRFSEEEELEEELEEMMRLSGLTLNEKAVSKQQQKFMGMVHAMQKGEKVKGASPKLKKAAKGMTKKAATDFASTKHKGLPKHVNESVELMDETRETLKHIANRYKYESKMFMQSGHMDQDLFHALYDYYRDKGEMPYSVVKGDAQPWVEEHFYMDMGSGMSESAHDLTELARLAGLQEQSVNEWGDSPLNKPPQPQSSGAAPSFAPRERERVVSPKVNQYDKDKEQAEKARRWMVDKESPKANDFGRKVGAAIAEPVAAVKSAFHGASDAWDQAMGNDIAPDPKPPVSVMKPNQWKGDRDNPALKTTPPNSIKENEELNQMRRIAGLKECGDMGVNQSDSMSVNTNMDSEGSKSVSISAQGDKADSLLQMLKMAGMRPHDDHEHEEEIEPVAIISTDSDEMIDEGSSQRLVKKLGDAVSGAKIYKDMDWNEYIVKFYKNGRALPEEAWYHTNDIQDAIDTAESELSSENAMRDAGMRDSMEEEYANEPEEEYQTVDSIIHQGNDLNREKRQFKHSYRNSDNPMAINEFSLDEALEEMLESVKVKEDGGAGGIEAEKPYRDERTGKMVYPPKGATMPPPDSEFPPGDPRNSAPLKKPSMSSSKPSKEPSSSPKIPRGMNIEPDDGILNLPMKQRGGR
ncbi:hypothetical protein UFOVP257_42 [uncultured Caudovirales phage]|uniref:Uncharacterized protein n=1 Tax=uncultured Caudovirales phage TaxID=2100421 RepID=A0A6J5LMU1_9CAUD|nr:hypothetical protein UFOVP257_42 [uncultured Caudovirales phage]